MEIQTKGWKRGNVETINQNLSILNHPILSIKTWNQNVEPNVEPIHPSIHQSINQSIKGYISELLRRRHFLHRDFRQFLIPAPHFPPQFPLIPPIAERLDRIHIERMLPLANPRLSHLDLRLLLLPIHRSAVLPHAPLQFRGERLLILRLVELVLATQMVEFLPFEREILAAPSPRHGSQTVRLLATIRTARTAFLARDRGGLKPVRENNIRVHRTHIQVINDGRFTTSGAIAKKL